MLMCIQNLVRFCQFVLKILSGNEMLTESRNHGMTEPRNHGTTEGQGESSIAPLFQSGAIMTFGQGQEKTLTLSVSTKFQVTGYKTSWKIQCLHFFSLKSLFNQNWPCRKISQGQPKVMIYINYDGPESPMLHNGDLDHFYKLSFPLPKDAPHEVWLWLAKRFQRRRSLKLWIDDGQKDNGSWPPISSPCETNGSGD